MNNADSNNQLLRRRAFLKSAALWGSAFAIGHPLPEALALPAVYTHPFSPGQRKLVAYPGKRPLIVLTSRPPQLETPFSVFNEGVLTPNDAFFVRYHWSGLPNAIDPEKFRLTVDGHVRKPLSISLTELRNWQAHAEIVAVNQCSGNGRGFSEPRVNGGQLGNGAMGNAKWTGVPLTAILERAGVRSGAVSVALDGLDSPALLTGPDYVKSLDIDHALNGEVIVAFAMNGEELPYLNGFPLRLVVPGYYGTYWVKHLSRIHVSDKPFDGYWMRSTYRIPDNPCACIPPGTKAVTTVPISKMNIRSFITSHSEGAEIPARRTTELRGIAFDGGAGIKSVALSSDGGRTWKETVLGRDHGRFSFREWRTEIAPHSKGELLLMSRAKSASGDTQPMELRWNGAGYMRNVVETVRVRIV